VQFKLYDNDMAMFILMLRLCSFTGYFEYSNVNITVGNVLVDSYLYLWRQTEREFDAINGMSFHSLQKSVHTLKSNEK
jgi:hypothetical protein